MTEPKTIAITGGAGRIATALRARLTPEGHRLTLVDVARPAALASTERALVGTVTDRALLDEAFADADLVVHLGGLASERPWARILDANIDGTQAVFERAQASGVRRVLYASSIHAAGYATLGALRTAPVDIARPDTYYGVGKIAGEAVGAVFADRFVMTVVSARIASFSPEPANPRAVGLWLSPDDTARLVRAVAELDAPGHHVVWGVSANTRGMLPLDAGRRIGYVPEDDAERFAGRFDEAAIRAALADDRLAADAFVDAAHPLGG